MQLSLRSCDFFYTIFLQCKSLKTDISDIQILLNLLNFPKYLKNHWKELGFRIAFEPSHFIPEISIFFKKKVSQIWILDPLMTLNFHFIVYLMFDASRLCLRPGLPWRLKDDVLKLLEAHKVLDGVLMT